MEKRKKSSLLKRQQVLSLIKSLIKSLELFLTLKNKKFYYDLHREHRNTEAQLINEIEKLRSTGLSSDADRADILRRRLDYETRQFEHLSAFYAKTEEE
tara:strand:+ start:576 stop:872 length:297 start_codon:yes stop_codon:yes gene_type:complete